MSGSAESLPRYKAENAALPQNSDQQIVSPRYVPANSSYLDNWRRWCMETPKAKWPEWLKRDIAEMKVRNTSARSTKLEGTTP